MIVDTTKTKIERDVQLRHVQEQLAQVYTPDLVISCNSFSYTNEELDVCRYSFPNPEISYFASVHTTENWDKATERREKHLAAGESDDETN